MKEAILSVSLGAILHYDTQSDEALDGSLRALMDDDKEFRIDMERLAKNT